MEACGNENFHICLQIKLHFLNQSTWVLRFWNIVTIMKFNQLKIWTHICGEGYGWNYMKNVKMGLI
jgi:hypothetical protein